MCRATSTLSGLGPTAATLVALVSPGSPNKRAAHDVRGSVCGYGVRQTCHFIVRHQRRHEQGMFRAARNAVHPNLARTGFKSA